MTTVSKAPLKAVSGHSSSTSSSGEGDEVIDPETLVISYQSEPIKHKVSEDDEDEGDTTADGSSTYDKNQGESGQYNGNNMMNMNDEPTRDGATAAMFSKFMVYVMLTWAVIQVATVVWFVTYNEEDHNFESEFRQFSNEIIKTTESNAQTMIDATKLLSLAATSYTLESSRTWPFVHLPDFEYQTNQARKRTGLEVITMLPLVQPEERDAYDSFSKQNVQKWLTQGLALQGRSSVIPLGDLNPRIYRPREDENQTDYFLPVSQMGPAPDMPNVINLDSLTYLTIRQAYQSLTETRDAVVSEILLSHAFYEMSYSWYDSKIGLANQYWDKSNAYVNADYYGAEDKDTHPVEADEPHSYILQPIFESFDDDAKIVGSILGIVPWNYYFKDLLPDGINGFVAVVNDNCGSSMTYEINGPNVEFVGLGDFHNPDYNYIGLTVPFTTFQEHSTTCAYDIKIYPTFELHQSYHTHMPLIYTVTVMLLFSFTAMILVLYERAVKRRQDAIYHTAAKTQAIVSSLFPESVQKRILEDAHQPLTASHKSQLKNFLEDKSPGDDAAAPFGSRPIADLFPECTVLFADISGFTAWSSTREPSQVFTLLETIYHEFDEIAKSRRVFKVETVGDCYVAVAGLPDPRRDHAVVMSRFACDCMRRMHILTKQLEVSLGPDTTELSMRFGLHSGPVTAGVLRGERARFQLFGDTVNTASRMESTGKRDCIQISQSTADLLVGSGKQHWISPREDKVHAKGKGDLQTYWLDTNVGAPKPDKSAEAGETVTENEHDYTSAGGNKDSHDSVDQSTLESVQAKTLEAKQQRLIDWNTALLVKQLRLIVVQREMMRTPAESELQLHQVEHKDSRRGSAVIEEAVDVINLPQFNALACIANKDPNKVQLGSQVEIELRDYVQTIAALYRDNPFHNFEHASHVTMSTVKLLSRIVAPDMDKVNGNDALKFLHDHTYGITSDPLTQFSVIFSALIHDVDHTGVPNSTLIKEKANIASVYKGKSVAEQNSVDIAWDLLMDDGYRNLRRTIYQTTSEYGRFRQLVVNSVLATDIMDKDLGAQRKARWNRAFADPDTIRSHEKLVNQKATIVIEHLIQASDVAHTMQHWHIYTKWNERLFEELYVAYKDGRADTNPADNWYQGEIGFYDFYIIPLAMKLRSCGVFGVSSDEYLSYAHQNRHEWELKGQARVANMLEKYERKYSGRG